MDDETVISKNRIEALTDGIFAVVMTLLVLDISIPQISSHYAIGNVAAGTELLKRLFDLWPKIVSFGVSFDSVKCQSCGMAVPIISKLARPHNDRVAVLQKRIKWIENYSHDNNSNNKNDVIQLKQELADLLEEDAKADKLRSLPLYSCRITG
jgi:hypothetical protein